VYECLTDIMHPTTVHGVGVITKFIPSFCGIQWINDLESRWKVIQGHRFWYQSKARTHVPISGQWQLGPYLAPFPRYGVL